MSPVLTVTICIIVMIVGGTAFALWFRRATTAPTEARPTASDKHFVDFYPAIYRGEDIRGAVNFRLPQLTYADDHPGEDLPAFRFVVEVTEG